VERANVKIIHKRYRRCKIAAGKKGAVDNGALYNSYFDEATAAEK